MSQTLLLLDFDGVLLKNRRLTEYQYKQSAAFVQKHTGIGFKACESLNAQCFPKYGHTVLMLNYMFRARVTLKDYNDYVFNKETLETLRPLVDDPTRQHFNSFAPFLEKCERAKVDSAIFTNADYNWVNFFVDELSEDPIFKQMEIMYPTKLSELKPKKHAYDKLEAVNPSAEEFWFVDDSLVNLTEPALRPNWIPFNYRASTKIQDMQNHFGLL